MAELRKTLETFELRENTLVRDVKANPADRITLEIGDSKEPGQFMPQAKVQRWDNEVNLSVRRVKAAKGAQVADVRGSHAVFEDDDEEVHIYEKPEIGEDGGLEIELHLKSKPITNRFDFSIRTKGLDFFYQPALTKEEIAEGASQPDNVVGSYAVYHKTGRNNRVGGMEYKTGKFCHIYRPHVTDAAGNEVWGELEIDVENETLTVVVPPKFLATATYPVIVDPTFGYTSVGGGLYETFDFSSFSKKARAIITPGSVHTANAGEKVVSYSAYCRRSDSGSDTIQASVYSFDDGLPQNLLTPVASITIDSQTPQWWESSLVDNLLQEGVTYCPAYGTFSVGTVCYRDNVSGASSFDVNLSGGLPSSWVDETIAGFLFSIYATYTVAPSASPPTVTTQAVSSINETTATGNGNVTDDGGDTITERGVCWSTSPTPTTENSKATSAGTTGAFTAAMTGLTANTLYYVRAYAINSEGTRYGAQVTFTTLSGVSLPTVVTYAVTNIQET